MTDDGPGIGPEIRGRIFEPFFTTKEVGQGTGLGLSISHGIAASHGGSLELCPGSGSGACFRLTLPAFIESGHGTVRGAGPQRENAMRALVVDDEAAIRRLLARLLERRGFEVCDAHSGEAALAIAESTPVSLVLCDVSLPGMSGSDLYRELSIRDPKIARSFVFITGDRSKVHLDDDVNGLPVTREAVHRGRPQRRAGADWCSSRGRLIVRPSSLPPRCRPSAADSLGIRPSRPP